MTFKASLKQILSLGIVILALQLFIWDAHPAEAQGTVSVCSEAALLTAVSGSGLVNFNFSGSCVIRLTASITITVPTLIDGAGQDITISGNNTVRPFIVNTGGALTLRNLTISDGKSVTSIGGGAILNQGTVTIINSIFSHNTSRYYGGAIHNRANGVLTVINSEFNMNSALGPGNAQGGAIEIENGTALIVNSWFGTNQARDVDFGAGGGGAISLSDGSLTVVNSEFVNNAVLAGRISTANGGAISLTSTQPVNISGSLFNNNRTEADSTGDAPGDESRGGAIYSYNYGVVTITNSSFVANQALGIGSRDSGRGGAWYNDIGHAIFTNSTFVENEAHGGTDIASNGLGGAFYLSGQIEISSSTFANNHAEQGDALGSGGVFYSDQGGSDSIILNNNVFSNNTASDTNPQCRALNPGIITGSNNLVFPDLGGCPAAEFPIIDDPLLEPFGDYGGPTPTMALDPGSPALDGASANCSAIDQRYYTRPSSPTLCDLGAYQLTDSIEPQPPQFTVTIDPTIFQDSSLLTMTFSNPVGNRSLSHINFNDVLPLGTVTGNVPGEVPENTCGGQSVAVGPTHADAVSAYSIALAPGNTCHISLPIIAYVSGSFTNQIDTIFVSEIGIVTVYESANLITLPGLFDDVPALNFFTDDDPVLTWNGFNWATGYEIQIDDSSDFQTPLDDNDQLSATTLTYPASNLSIGRYYWRVRAKSSSGNWGSWSATQAFTYIPPS